MESTRLRSKGACSKLEVVRQSGMKVPQTPVVLVSCERLIMSFMLAMQSPEHPFPKYSRFLIRLKTGPKTSHVCEAVNTGNWSNFTLVELDYKNKLEREHKDVSKVIPTPGRNSTAALGTTGEQHTMTDEDEEEIEPEEGDHKREGAAKEEDIEEKGEEEE